MPAGNLGFERSPVRPGSGDADGCGVRGGRVGQPPSPAGFLQWVAGRVLG